MSLGTAISIPFLLVRWSVGVGCKSSWYSICGRTSARWRYLLQGCVFRLPQLEALGGAHVVLGLGALPPHPSCFPLTRTRLRNKFLIGGGKLVSSELFLQTP